MTAVCASITPDVWSAAPSHSGAGVGAEQWNTRGTFGVEFRTADAGLIRYAVLTLIAKKQSNPCNRPET